MMKIFIKRSVECKLTNYKVMTNDIMSFYIYLFSNIVNCDFSFKE